MNSEVFDKEEVKEVDSCFNWYDEFRGMGLYLLSILTLSGKSKNENPVSERFVLPFEVVTFLKQKQLTIVVVTDLVTDRTKSLYCPCAS